MPGDHHPTVAAAIGAALLERGEDKTICPSVIARRLAANGPDWRDRMADVHASVDALLAEGRLSLTWRGQTLVKRDGPYRIGRPLC